MFQEDIKVQQTTVTKHFRFRYLQFRYLPTEDNQFQRKS